MATRVWGRTGDPTLQIRKSRIGEFELGVEESRKLFVIAIEASQQSDLRSGSGGLLLIPCLVGSEVLINDISHSVSFCKKNLG